MKSAAAVMFVLWALLGDPSRSAEADTPVITVFAATSLTNVLQDLGDEFTKETSVPVKFSFAASSALARQIESGAAADVFISADVLWMDRLQNKHLIQEQTRHDVIGNRLVLIAPVDSLVKLKIEPHFPLAEALGTNRLASGDPDSVSVGRYAQTALTKLGVWSEVSERLMRAENARAVLAFVDRGEAALGIVYETDALIDKHVRIVDVFPADSHAPIVYPMALTTSARPPAAKLAAFIRGPAGAIALKAYGFSPLPE